MYSLTDVVKKLLFLNVAIYVVATMILPSMVPGFKLGMLTPFFFDSNSNLHFNPDFQPYTLVTHMFMHDDADSGHLISNMLGLFFFGPAVERALGEKRFVILYFVSAFAAIFAHFVSDYFMMDYSYLVGASGAISGILFAFVMMHPHRKITLLIPPIPVKAMYLAMILFAVDLYRGFMNTRISGFAHIGGAIAGVLLILYWRKSNFKL